MSRLRRALSFGSAVAVGVVAALVLFAVVGGIALMALLPDSEVEVIADEDLLARTEAQLEEIVVQLEGLPSYDGTGERHSDLVGCVTDSGQLFQPAARHGWSVDEGTSGADILDQVADDLAAAGWTGEPRAADGNTRSLVLDGPGFTTSVVLYTDPLSNGAVVIEARIVGAGPCRVDE